MFFGTRLVAWFSCGFSVLTFLSTPGLGWHLRECGLHSEEAHAHFIPVQRNPGVEWIHVQQGKSMEFIREKVKA